MSREVAIPAANQLLQVNEDANKLDEEPVQLFITTWRSCYFYANGPDRKCKPWLPS
jgi:hypothetical protein